MSSGEQKSRLEEGLYVAVTRAWCRMYTPVARRQCPLRPYIFGPYMARTVAAARVDSGAVAVACAELASLEDWKRHSGEEVPLEEPARRAGDPFRAWWRRLAESDLGLHYAELGSGLFEFQTVARQLDLPPAIDREQP